MITDSSCQSAQCSRRVRYRDLGWGAHLEACIALDLGTVGLGAVLDSDDVSEFAASLCLQPCAFGLKGLKPGVATPAFLGLAMIGRGGRLEPVEAGESESSCGEAFCRAVVARRGPTMVAATDED